VVILAGLATLWTLRASERGDMVLTLVEVDGTVHITQAGGQITDGTAGLALSAQDHVATDASSRAVLGLGGQTRIRVGPESALKVTSVNHDGVRLELEGGALTATVRPDSGAVRIGNGGRSVLVTNADFNVAVHDDLLVVGATRGGVSLTGVNVTTVEEGSVATVVDRDAQVGPVPEELVLDVEWPEPRKTRLDNEALAGHTTPGAMVVVTGPWGQRRVRADSSGSFSLSLPLVEGANAVQIHAVDLFGNEAQVDGDLQTRDTQGPTFSGGARYGR